MPGAAAGGPCWSSPDGGPPPEYESYGQPPYPELPPGGDPNGGLPATYPPGPPAPARRQQWAVPRIVGGVLLLLIGVPQVIRAMSLTLLSLTRPGAYDTAEALGQVFGGSLFVVLGAWLLHRGQQILKARRPSRNPPPPWSGGWPQQWS